MSDDTLKDGTSASQAGGFGASASDLKRGYVDAPVEKTDRYANDSATSEQVGDPLAFNPGFLGRPRGWAR